jgi:hypothetical protein
MGAVYKKTATKPLPAGAKIFVRKGLRLAEWKDAKGKTRTAPLTIGQDGTDRLVITAKTSSDSDQWAMRGSNPRPPRCKRGALTN